MSGRGIEESKTNERNTKWMRKKLKKWRTIGINSRHFLDISFLKDIDCLRKPYILHYWKFCELTQIGTKGIEESEGI
jgi:hypothetical protein